MKDISLYGHLTIDTLLDGETEKKTLGSIANVWKALVGLDCSLNIGLSPIDIGYSVGSFLGSSQTSTQETLLLVPPVLLPIRTSPSNQVHRFYP